MERLKFFKTIQMCSRFLRMAKPIIHSKEISDLDIALMMEQLMMRF
jgi:hypothetical protein